MNFKNKLKIFFTYLIYTSIYSNNTYIGSSVILKKEISFIENKGQISDQYYKPRPDVLFGGKVEGLTFHLRNTGISYQLNRIDSWKEEDIPFKEKKKMVPDQITNHRIDINWLGINSGIIIEKRGEHEGFDNYYLGSCSNGALYVKSYSEIEYKNIYNNIDLKYYSKNGVLKYDYFVAPYANYKEIRFEILGAEKISLNSDGSITIKTPLGNIIEEAPLVLQEGREIKSKWIIKGNVITYGIEDYDNSKALIIDPITRVWGTYYGGAGNEITSNISSDNNGNVFLFGYTLSSNGTSIATSGAFQNSFGGTVDLFLVKFNKDGVRQWGTYYGDNSNDIAGSCATDSQGNIYICGSTTSSNSAFYTTMGCHQSMTGGVWESYLAKFNSFGVRQWATFYGGNGNEYVRCNVDKSDNPYLFGQTSTSTGTAIVTLGSQQSVFGGGGQDGFITKFNPNGVRIWGTYLGGNDVDDIADVQFDNNGNFFVCGRTMSTVGFSTLGCHQINHAGGGLDAYLAKFNVIGMLQWCTYYGGGVGDEGASVHIYNNSEIYLCGNTSSLNGGSIATIGSHQYAYGGGSNDGFLAKFDYNGVRQWGTYYGGNLGDDAASVFCNALGDVYITGGTGSGTGTVIATIGSYQPIFGGGFDSYIAMFNSNGVRQWGTYFGGSIGENDMYGLCNMGYIYCAGSTASTGGTVIASIGSHQIAHGGDTWDSFLEKFVDCSLIPVNAVSSPTNACVGNSLTLNAYGAESYTWLPSNNNSSNIVITPTTNVTYTLVGAVSSCTNNGIKVINVNTMPLPSISIASTASVLCANQTATLTSSGANSYTWSNSSVSSSVAVTLTATTTFTTTGINSNGCKNTAVFTQSVSTCTGTGDHETNPVPSLIYPNPNNGTFDFVLSANSNFIITNILGQIIVKDFLLSGKHKVNIQNQPKGLYFIKFENESGKNNSLKFIID